MGYYEFLGDYSGTTWEILGILEHPGDSEKLGIHQRSLAHSVTAPLPGQLRSRNRWPAGWLRLGAGGAKPGAHGLGLGLA